MADRVEDVVVAPPADRVVGVARRGLVPRGSRHRSAAGHRRQEADLVGRRDRRVEPGEVADVLAVDVDVDEPVEVAVVGQELRAERRVLLDERVDDRPDRSRRRARAT